MTELKNIIDGKECCWRCGVNREQAKPNGCKAWGLTYPHHLWEALTDSVLRVKVEAGNTSNKCGVCRERGHSARTCPREELVVSGRGV